MIKSDVTFFKCYSRRRSLIRKVRRFVVFIIGLAMVLSGTVMLVAPGPGWLLLFAGLSTLALEFAWARRLLKTIKAKGAELSRRIAGNKS